MNLRVLEQRLNKIQEESTTTTPTTTNNKSDDNNKEDEEEEEEGEVEDDLETGDLSDDPSTLPEDEPNFVPNQVCIVCPSKIVKFVQSKSYQSAIGNLHKYSLK